MPLNKGKSRYRRSEQDLFNVKPVWATTFADRWMTPLKVASLELV